MVVDSKRRQRKPGRRRSGVDQLGYVLFLLPAVALLGSVVYYAIGYTGYLSFFAWDGLSPFKQNVGLANFRQLLHDPIFWASIEHTAVYAIAIPVTMAIGLMLAVVLHSNVFRFTAPYKIIIFVPVVLAPAVMAPVFRQMLAPDGQVNGLLRDVGLGSWAHAWLASPHWALVSLMVIFVWNWSGFSFLIYFASLTLIDSSMLEAARMDGATNLRIVVSFLLPLSKSSTYSLLILSLVGLLKTFDVPYLVTSGGPDHGTEFLGTYLYRESIASFKVGYGAAITVVIVALSIALSGTLVRRFRAAGTI